MAAFALGVPTSPPLGGRRAWDSEPTLSPLPENAAPFVDIGWDAMLQGSALPVPRAIRKPSGKPISPVAPRPGNDRVAAKKQQLIQRFGIPEIRDGTAKWSLSELETIEEALGRMHPEEIRALDRVVFVRQRKLNIEGQPGAMGVFRFEAGVNNGKLHHVEQLQLDDNVFAKDARERKGRWRPSLRTILHEIGHAVETKEQREAVRAVNSAAIAYNNALLARESSRSPKERQRLAQAAQQKRAILDRAVARQEATLRTQKCTKRLGAFLDVVNQSGELPFTRYAIACWPKQPNEYFAEAYSVYRATPNRLKRETPAVFAFFERNGHLI